jgi:hypothetical protein
MGEGERRRKRSRSGGIVDLFIPAFRPCGGQGCAWETVQDRPETSRAGMRGRLPQPWRMFIGQARLQAAFRPEIDLKLLASALCLLAHSLECELIVLRCSQSQAVGTGGAAPCPFQALLAASKTSRGPVSAARCIEGFLMQPLGPVAPRKEDWSTRLPTQRIKVGDFAVTALRRSFLPKLGT